MNSFLFALLISLLLISFQTNLVYSEEQDLETEVDGFHSKIFQAILDHDFDLLQSEVFNGEKLDIFNEHGWSPVRFAIETNDLEALKFILQQGADIDAQDDNGVSPLIASAKHVSSILTLRYNILNLFSIG